MNINSSLFFFITCFISIIIQTNSDNVISITISPWSECDCDVGVQTRNVYCLDSKGKVEPEIKCPGIDELKHYQECDCGGSSKKQPNKNKNKNHKDDDDDFETPTYSPTHSPTHDRNGFFPDDEDDNDDGEEGGMLVSSDVLTTLVDQTKRPTSSPTSYPTLQRTHAPTTNFTRFEHLKALRLRYQREAEEAQSFSRVEMVGIVALLSFMVIFIVFLSMFCCGQANSDTSGDYAKVLQEDDNFEFPEDRDNPFEYFNEPEEAVNDIDHSSSVDILESPGIEMTDRSSPVKQD